MRRMLVVRLAFICYLVFLLVLAHGVTIAIRGVQMYRYIKGGGAIMTDGVIGPDSVLGYAPVPGSSGLMTWKYPPPIPYQYNQYRYRVTNDPSNNQNRGPVFLFLGGSFTHGDLVENDRIFASIVAKHFDGEALNRAFCGYGLSQMILIAKEVIPSVRPDYVVAQYSRWTADRSMSHFAPIPFTRRPQPFFYVNAEGKIVIHPPPYHAYIGQTPAAEYRDSIRSLRDQCSFIWKVSIPLYINEDARFFLYTLCRWLGLVPQPVTDRQEVIRVGYRTIAQLCAENGSKLVIPILGLPQNEPIPEDIAILEQIPGAVVVNCWSNLVARLPQYDPQMYFREYAHYRDTSPLPMDPHPNQKAHAIIADSIVKAIYSGMLNKQP